MTDRLLRSLRALGSVVLVALVTPAGATENNDSPTGPQGAADVRAIRFYTVGNGDLRPVGAGFFGTSFGPFPGGTFSTAAAPLLAGVHLPQDTQILGMRSHVLDNSSSDMTIELIEQALPGGEAAVIASTTTTGAAAAPYSIDDILLVPRRVNNLQFHYFVRVSPRPGWTATSLQVVGVTIAYTLEGT